MSRETKTLELEQVKVSLDGPGSFAGYASAFNKVDSYGDTVLPGAYKATIPEFVASGFIGWSHNAFGFPVGFPTKAREDDYGLYLEGQFHSTDEAQKARAVAAERIAAGKPMGLSIGYSPTEFDYTADGIRQLKQIELYETSFVLLPADAGAAVAQVKAEEKAVWTTAFVNNLPDAAFAIVLPGGSKDSEGKTTPRSLRKLPHHGSDGKVDEPHLRNALSREPQTDMSESQHSTASAHLSRHASAMGIGKAELLDVDVPFDELLLQVKGWLEYGTDEAEALRDRRASEERKLSDAHLAAIAELHQAAEAVKERLGALLVEPPAAEAELAGFRRRLELRRHSAALRGIHLE